MWKKMAVSSSSTRERRFASCFATIFASTSRLRRGAAGAAAAPGGAMTETL